MYCDYTFYSDSGIYQHQRRQHSVEIARESLRKKKLEMDKAQKKLEQTEAKKKPRRKQIKNKSK